MSKIVMIPLREQVRNRIAEQLWKGVYSFGDDLNEARLAEELGVSRTPLREGLVMLASEGLIEALPNRGFHVPMIDAKVVAELYPIIGMLEALAIESGCGDVSKQVADLNRINQRFTKPKASKFEQNSTDADWHQRLVADCLNATLIHEIDVLRARSRCIDGAIFRGIANVERAQSDHKAIADLIESGQRKKAARRVRQHWLEGIDIVTEWLEASLPKDVV